MVATLGRTFPESQYYKDLDPRIEAVVVVRHTVGLTQKSTSFHVWDNGQVVRDSGPVSQEALAEAVECAQIHGFKAWSR